MTKPENLISNAFLDNLGTDFVAVADNGQIVGRAGSEAAIRHAVPDAAHYLTGSDLAPEGFTAFDQDGNGKPGSVKMTPVEEPAPEPVAEESETDAAFNDTAELVPPDETPKPKTTRQRKPAGK